MDSATAAVVTSGIFGTVTTFITTNLLPAIIGLVVLSIAIKLGLGAVKKYARGAKG